MLDSFLDDLLCTLHDFLCITIGFLCFPGYLFAETFDLLLFAADKFPSLFLHFTSDIFHCSFDLIFVHDHIPSFKLAGTPCGKRRLNLMLPPVCAVTNLLSNGKRYLWFELKK